jgi:regulatory protein
MKVALHAVNARERTEHELRELLERRKVERPVVDEVVSEMATLGLVDDAGYAERFTADRRLLERWGRERITQDLERRGVDHDLIDRALSGVERRDELEAAIELLDRRYQAPFQGDRDRDKAWRMLVRRGYEAEIAYEAVRRHERGLDQAA